jgi:hypothetical protein
LIENYELLEQMVMNNEFEFVDLNFLREVIQRAKDATPLRTISKKKRE